MPTKKPTTRRAISLMGKTYARLKLHVAMHGGSISGYIEGLIAADLDARGVPRPDKAPERVRAATPAEVAVRQYFTF